MRNIYVIGMGSGDPDQLTLQAVKAMRRVDVFFLLDKGEEKADLLRLRHEILAEHAGDRPYRLVEARDPDRDRDSRAGTA
ncbi:precorrin 6A synthase, partial [Streptomyces sp. NRRL F-6602]